MSERGLGTRSVHGGLPAAEQGAPFLPGPVFASAYHFAGNDKEHVVGYLREDSPNWIGFETALGEIEGGDVVLFASGMAACSAILFLLEPGSVVVLPSDGYFGVRTVAATYLTGRGVEVREAPTDHDAVVAAAQGATMVWIETPSNPGMDVLDIARVRADIGPDVTLVVDNTIATPYFQRPLELGADLSVCSASKHITGHSDLLLGYVAVREPARRDALRFWRAQTGSIAGPFETWLAHRSLATFALRVERSSANTQAIAELLRSRPDVANVRYPGIGTVVCFELPDEATVQRFFAASELVGEATSFGGVHTTAERRVRWGTDAVSEGFIRFSAGIEDIADLAADLTAALDAAAR